MRVSSSASHMSQQKGPLNPCFFKISPTRISPCTMVQQKKFTFGNRASSKSVTIKGTSREEFIERETKHIPLWQNMIVSPRLFSPFPDDWKVHSLRGFNKLDGNYHSGEGEDYQFSIPTTFHNSTIRRYLLMWGYFWMHTNPPTVGRLDPFLGGKSHYVVFIGSYVIYVSNNPCAEIIEKTKGRLNKFPGWRPRPPLCG